MILFKKIRKWASEKGYTVKQDEHYPKIVVTANEKRFEIENRESTIYRSGRTGTLKGNAKGIYFQERDGYSYRVDTQQEAIERMEESIKK